MRIVKYIITVLLFFILLSISLVYVGISLENWSNNEPERRVKKETFDVYLSGKVIDIQELGRNNLYCIQIDTSNYREYRRESDLFFVRIKDSLAVIAMDTQNKNFYEYSIQVGSRVSIEKTKRFIILRQYLKNDTIGKPKKSDDRYLENGYISHPVLAQEDLKNSCIPK